MGRYHGIYNTTFDGVALNLVTMVLCRDRLAVQPNRDPLTLYPQSHQYRDDVCEMEIHLRDAAGVATLTPGQTGVLSFTIGGDRSGAVPRAVTINAAVLVGREYSFRQNDAELVLRFVGESPDGLTHPFQQEDGE